VVCLRILVFPEQSVAVLAPGHVQGGSWQDQTGMSRVGVGVGCVRACAKERERGLSKALLQKPRAVHMTCRLAVVFFLGVQVLLSSPTPLPSRWGLLLGPCLGQLGSRV